jgi:hypothetical protein
MCSILTHPSWIALNKDRDKPIIIDLVVKPFHSPGKFFKMIFIHTEYSRKEPTRSFFLSMYDGTTKQYPRGDMLLFIPIMSELEDDYTDSQRTKYLYKHTAYLGEDYCTAIFGLYDLNTSNTLKDGMIITTQTLLKSLLASHGMSRPRLFQVLDPNAAQICVLVIFQRCNRPLVEERKLGLEEELWSVIAPGESAKLFQDELEGLRLVGPYHKKKGKVI